MGIIFSILNFTVSTAVTKILWSDKSTFPLWILFYINFMYLFPKFILILHYLILWETPVSFLVKAILLLSEKNIQSKFTMIMNNFELNCTSMSECFTAKLFYFIVMFLWNNKDRLIWKYLCRGFRVLDFILNE